ncbi:ribonuclease H-like domain-containing protein [Tanacetum coccineum]
MLPTGPTPFYYPPGPTGPPPGFSQPTATPQQFGPNMTQPNYLSQPVASTGVGSVQGLTSSQPGTSGSVTTPGHATLFAASITVRTLHDPNTGAWNMDTRASSHLKSLSTVFNSCLYLSISVGDGHSIPVTNTRHSILPTLTRPLHLNNVLIIPHIVKNLIFVLLRCDSTGYLYLVTAPSPIPHVFLVSQHTWHQRLGHPKSDVLRRLVSNNVISCNNEKPLVLCHACQLGKHVRLPFVSSSTIVTSCFDIIHSDVWTSPIPSLSGYKYYVLFLDHYS